MRKETHDGDVQLGWKSNTVLKEKRGMNEEEMKRFTVVFVFLTSAKEEDGDEDC